MQWFGLLDCNNFYCSCERIFDPTLQDKPVAVLSNNDGCIISRSQEVKNLGILMGAPAFKIRQLIKQHAVQVYSSNYTLYGDISARVMNTLGELCPVVEVYSIDEAFLDLSILPVAELEPFAHKVRTTVRQWTKIPTCVGIAPTKTLAKVANKIAKKNPALDGVFVIKDDATRIAALEDFPVSDVWGIGSQSQKLLLTQGVQTALQFTRLNEQWVRSNMTVTGHRLLMELRGLSCVPMLEPRAIQKNVCSSRSFGQPQTTFDALSAAVSTFASTCGQKLREQNACASVLSVFIHTNKHRPDQPQYHRTKSINLPTASNSSAELIKYALYVLRQIFMTGPIYAKVGVIVTGIIPADQITVDLFDTADRARLKNVSLAMDSINRQYARNTVLFAAQMTQHKWQTKADRKSPCYTTRWEELLKVQLD
ncbi:Y-family DNA polymerase [Spirosoma pulveris]